MIYPFKYGKKVGAKKTEILSLSGNFLFGYIQHIPETKYFQSYDVNNQIILHSFNMTKEQATQLVAKWGWDHIKRELIESKVI